MKINFCSCQGSMKTAIDALGEVIMVLFLQRGTRKKPI